MILAEHDAKKLLHEAAIPIVPVTTVHTVEQAIEGARSLGHPVALKFSSARHSHKTEVGGVFLGLRDETEVERAFHEADQLRERLDPEASIILEPMAAGAEFFVGIQRHPNFGLVLSLGCGGVWLELLKDVTFRLLPATRADFQEMLGELKVWPKLHAGFRNLPPVNARPLLDLMEKVADLALKEAGIMEMDLNPVMAGSEDAVVVDARIVLQAP